MGCNSDHLNPTNKEKDSIEICNHIVFLKDEYRLKLIPVWAIEGVCHTYGAQGITLDAQTEWLCNTLKIVNDDFIYDGRNPKARKLADWWDAHKKADADREAEEIRLADLQIHKIKIYQRMKQKFTSQELNDMDIKDPEAN
jgi:hypothetical protein